MKLDLSVDDSDQSAAFYQHTLGAKLKSMKMGEHTAYFGRLPDGIGLAIAPHAMTGVEARGNVFQLNFQVTDLEAAMKAALANGGTELEPIAEQGGTKTASVRDPDGNSLVLTEVGNGK